MTEKIKLSKQAKEIIKNKNKEIKELTSKLEIIRKRKDKYFNENIALSEEAKQKEMYKKACSVLLAAVDEKRLMWSLAKEYDRMKEQDDLNQGAKNMVSDFDMSDIFKEDKKGAKKEEKETLHELNINLDEILSDFLSKGNN